MVTPVVGTVVLVRFPFSDLSASKLRPALVLADAERGDWVLCQITSQSYVDSKAIPISQPDFSSGSLTRSSFARPAKLFTANSGIMVKNIGELSPVKVKAIREAVIQLFT
ncbi:MAG: type II toxin-antitoxin system PemK/MazF family toxin [Pyrinomonadaceae bacterium]